MKVGFNQTAPSANNYDIQTVRQSFLGFRSKMSDSLDRFSSKIDLRQGQQLSLTVSQRKSISDLRDPTNKAHDIIMSEISVGRQQEAMGHQIERGALKAARVKAGDQLIKDFIHQADSLSLGTISELARDGININTILHTARVTTFMIRAATQSLNPGDFYLGVVDALRGEELINGMSSVTKNQKLLILCKLNDLGNTTARSLLDVYADYIVEVQGDELDDLVKLLHEFNYPVKPLSNTGRLLNKIF